MPIASGWTQHVKLAIANILHWPQDDPVHISSLIASILAMAGPVAAGAIVGKMELGLLAAFGAMAVSGVSDVRCGSNQARELLYAALAGIVAIFIGNVAEGHGWLTAAAMVMIAFVTALLGGMSRTTAQVGARLIIFTVIGLSIATAGMHHPDAAALLFAGGSLWGMIVAFTTARLFPSTEYSPTGLAKEISVTARITWWKRSLSQFSGWQYTLRITVCMAVAGAVGMVIQRQHSSWILLTVAIVMQRNFDTALVRIIQRGIGTIAGVLLGSLLLLWAFPPWMIVMVIALFAALRSLFQKRNYTVYAMLMTPLIVLLLGQEVTGTLLIERLYDTVIGCMIALIFGYMIWPKLDHGSRCSYRS